MILTFYSTLIFFILFAFGETKALSPKQEQALASAKYWTPQPLGTDIDDRHHDTQQIVEENGFKFEAHNVTTEDGYILALHRIVPESPDAPVVHLQHGIEDCDVQWVMNSPSLAPAFILARAGFDVWMGNNRGNYYSMSHVKYTSKQREFWDFDFEEMGLYDVPAFIDYELKVTGKKKIAAYIGHSEGTT